MYQYWFNNEFPYLFSNFKHFIIVFSPIYPSLFFYLKKKKNFCAILVEFRYRMEVFMCMFNSPPLPRSLIKFPMMNILC